MDEAAARAADLGKVGGYFLNLLRVHSAVVGDYGTVSFVADLVRLQGSMTSLRSIDRLLPVAVSLLLLPFPLQVQLDDGDILAIARQAAGVPFSYVISAKEAHGGWFGSVNGRIPRQRPSVMFHGCAPGFQLSRIRVLLTKSTSHWSICVTL